MKSLDRQCGFTLVELMIVVAVLGILAVLGVPSYLESVRAARREDATSFMQMLLGQQALYYSNYGGEYTLDVQELGHENVGNNRGALSEDGHYLITLARCPVGEGLLPLSECVRIAADAQSISQRKDLRCRTFSISSLGMRSAFDAEGNLSDVCWD